MATSLRRLLACAPLLLVAACGGRRATEGEGFTVARARPGAGSQVFLNQQLAVYFSEPVDALSVTADTVRVVDQDGHPVAMQSLEVGSQVVTVHPRPPVQATLDDGSFVPERSYWLEVAGYPQVNAVRSRRGNILARGLRLPLRAVGAGGTAEYPRPLLPVGAGNEPFTLDPTRRLEVQAGSRELQIHFTLPPHPPSVRPAAFGVQRLVAGTLQRVEVEEARVVRDPTDRFPGSTVQLQLRADPPIALSDRLALFVHEGEEAVVDFAGRPPVFGSGLGGPTRHVLVRSGAIEIARFVPTDTPALEALDLTAPGFEARDRTRLVPRVRRVAGSGAHGVLRPEASMRLGPCQALALAEGRPLELSALIVPEGVRLTIGGFTTPVRILVTGSVRIAGELVLETPRGPVSEFGAPPRPLMIREADLEGLAGCVIVAAGDIHVTGRIEHVAERAPMGTALALVAGGGLILHGRMPPGTICACEGDVVGDLQSARFHPTRLRSGYAGLRPVVASAATAWTVLPAWAQGPIWGEAIDADPGLDVLWQTAPPHALDPSRPDPRPDLWSQPRPLTEPVLATPGQFVRFVLRAEVEPGRTRLPGVGGISLSQR